jgi:hypothetical protein
MSKSPAEKANAAVLARPELPPGTDNGVTQEYLDNHHDLLTVTIREYAGQAVGDSIALCIGGPNASPLEYKKVGHPEGATKVDVSGTKLHRVGPGTHIMFYTVKPAHGPESPNSAGTFVRLFPEQ